MNLAPLSIKFISQLANNSDSLVPMATKDCISNTAIVATYKKEGGIDDARERAIEEFGTGIAWLFAIPAIKKIADKTLYPLLKLNPNLDCRNLKDEFIEQAKNAKNISQEEKNIFQNLDKKTITKYKGAFIGKFLIATAASAFALIKIIQWKQKTTQQRIEKDVLSAHYSSLLINKKTKEEKLYQNFTSKLNPKKQEISNNSQVKQNEYNKDSNNNKNINFKGNIAQTFLYNPIANTSILDGVITGTRLIEARKGEKKEVALKEAFQILFIYKLAKPVQKFFEFIGNKINCPVELDPIVLFDKNLSNNLDNSKETVKNLLDSIKDKDKTQAAQYLKDSIYNLDIIKDQSLLELLEQNQVIKLIKNNKNEIQGISYLNFVEGNNIKNTLKGLEKLSENYKNLKGIKAYKVFSVIANVLFAAWAMGRLQPKVNIALRKLLHNGDNRNPAIVAQEEEMIKKLKTNQQ